MASVVFHGTAVSMEDKLRGGHTGLVLGHLQDLILDFSPTETAHLGYIRSGSPSEHEAYRADAIKLADDEAGLREATSDSPGQVSTLAAQATRIPDQTTFDETVVNLQHEDAAANALRGDTNTRTIVKIEDAVARVRNEDTRLLATRSEVAARRSIEANAVLMIGTILQVLIIAATGWKAPHAMVVVNESGAIVPLDVEAERQFGRPHDEPLGHRVKDILLARDLSCEKVAYYDPDGCSVTATQWGRTT